MTPRPGRIAAAVAVPIERPRRAQPPARCPSSTTLVDEVGVLLGVDVDRSGE